MNGAIGMVEFNSIARGIEAADAMLKAGMVSLYTARSVCPGKFIALVYGEVAAVQSAVDAGVRTGGDTFLDQLVIPNVDSMVFPALTGCSEGRLRGTLGVIETFTLASLIVAADRAAKAGEVELLEIRLGIGIGGKAYVTLCGEVAAVQSAVSAGSAAAGDVGLLVSAVVIPSPHNDLKDSLL